MADRDTDYVLVRKRRSRKPRQCYYDDDADDDDIGSQIYRRLGRRKARKDRRIRYMPDDEEDESDYRGRSSDSRIQIRKTANGDRVILDEDDNVIKVIRNARSPTPTPPVEDRRLKRRPRQSQSIFYETPDGHLVPRPSKRNYLQTKKTPVVYVNSESTKMMKKVIIDPRTGDRETFYEKDVPKRQQKYFLRQHPAEILDDSDDDSDRQQTQYIKLVKPRPIQAEVIPKRTSSPRYFMTKSRAEPTYGYTSKMPAIKSNRRVVYQVPAKKPVTTYMYSSEGRYYK